MISSILNLLSEKALTSTSTTVKLKKNLSKLFAITAQTRIPNLENSKLASNSRMKSEVISVERGKQLKISEKKGQVGELHKDSSEISKKSSNQLQLNTSKSENKGPMQSPKGRKSIYDSLREKKASYLEASKVQPNLLTLQVQRRMIKFAL